jgi:hypothetical protein
MKLYEINAEMESLIEANIDFETGEINPKIEEQLSNLDIERDKKIEGIAIVVKIAKVDSDVIANEIKRLQSMKKSLENKQNFLKQIIKAELAGEKFKTHRVSIYYSSSESVEIDYTKPESANIADKIETLNSDLVKVEKTLRLTEIKKQLKAGIDLPFLSLKKKQSIVIR